ncbi:GNAT family N-acetyltransferase [Albimonas pacifica]|uniref:Acetyltransferase (GNAT) family protein n=1 Tax=Albimonas pacifica TaxID=1114924 RepID=A0A1I3N4A1_9RHOB|nr:GNAT family N-acetyltransferase [Albimonas pacifica]SFJ03850.1 Acetyltransferase (GNAT) family protein [Albimonas pacifica]
MPIFDLDLAPPLRFARPSDAMTLAVLSNEAGCGIPWHMWAAKAGPGGEAWTLGAAAMLGEIASGALVVDEGQGAVASMTGQPMREALPLDGLPPIRAAIQGLQNRALDCWYVRNLAVLPSLRGRGNGHGRRLLAGAVRIASAEGLSAVSLIVNDGNTEALRLYERLGFEVVASAPQAEGFGWRPWGREWLLMRRGLDAAERAADAPAAG